MTHNEYANDEEEESAFGWEKPSWTKAKLKSTGKMSAMKKDGNLAAPITFTPYKNDDHSNKVANPQNLKKSNVGNAAKEGINLAAPITFTPFKSDDHTNYVANPKNLRTTKAGQIAKTQGNLAMPITNIRDVKVKKGAREAAQ